MEHWCASVSKDPVQAVASTGLANFDRCVRLLRDYIRVDGNLAVCGDVAFQDGLCQGRWASLQRCMGRARAFI